MEVWVGSAIAVLFSLIFVRRIARREFAYAALAAGMALMAAGMMGGLAGHPVQGPWWAAVFGVLAVWPLVWSDGWQWPVRGEQLQHATAGLAMVYMCAAMPAAGVYRAGTTWLAGSHHGGDSTIFDVGTTSGLGLPLVGWLFASFFLLQAIGSATRRTVSTASAASPVSAAHSPSTANSPSRVRPLRALDRADAAAMGGGMAVMLLAAL